MKILIYIAAVISINSYSCIKGNYLFPKNSLKISPEKVSNITEVQFNEIIDRVVDIYQPIFREKRLTLKSFANWNSDQVNARADRRGRTRRIIIFGGMGRHELVTADELSMVVCHEIGHHIGGAPKASSWASGEGQADYFSTTKCLRRLFKKFPKTLNLTSIPNSVQSECRESFTSEEDALICMRSRVAGYNLTKLFSVLNGTQAPNTNTNDTNEVSRTNHRHPQPQCRYDTFSAGALCEIPFDDDFANNDETVGSCHALNGHTTGLRPRCWFKPSMTYNLSRI